MRIYKYITILFFFNISLVGFCQNEISNPITKAMMNVYQQLIEENPHDYETYFKRANEYYNHNQYIKALNDINNALKYIPSKETDMKFQSLCLRASIYEVTQNYEKALNDLTSAYTIDPNSYTVLYRKANAEYLIEMYDDAKKDYQRMLRMNNRSIEALIGLSRIATIEKNLGLANEYADNAVALYPNNAEVYIRRATVRKLMGNNNGAVDDLIIAISIDNQNTKALYELVEMGNCDYPAVMSGLSNAIRQAPRVGMFYYIRGIIAKSHFNYVAALTDFKKIIQDNLYNYHGIYSEIAECQYALGKYNDAIYNINYAINTSSTVKSEYYVLKAQILRALGNSTEALDCCNIAIEQNQNYTHALTIKGLCLSDLNKYNESLALYGEAILNEANNPYNYFLRAELFEKQFNKPIEANILYERIIDMDYDENDINSYKGFALAALNQEEEAIRWIENILLKHSDNDGYINYIASCLYAQIGDFNKSFECMKNSLQMGYANSHNWVLNSDTKISTLPIRKDKRFKKLLQQYSIIFND